MRLGALVDLQQLAPMGELTQQGLGFLEIQAPHRLDNLPERNLLPALPLIWQTPADLPCEHPALPIRAGVLEVWRAHLEAAKGYQAALLIVQFRRPDALDNKAALIDQYTALLHPLTAEARAAGIQLALRNGPDNRDQLNLLREVVRQIPGLGIALDMAYAHQGVVKNLTPEYLWDSDLGPRLAHLYASDSNGRDPQLRLPLGTLGTAGPDWTRLARQVKERYNASITLDIGQADPSYWAISRAQWLSWWGE
jgi:sugar phosphate isomerase/epimerase